MKSEAFDIGQAVAVVRRRVGWIVIAAVLGAAIAFVWSSAQTKRYTATAQLLFTTGSTSQQIAGFQPVNPNAGQSGQALQNTNVELVKAGHLESRVSEALGGTSTPADVRSALVIEPVGDTNFVAVSATSTSPGLASQIANTYSRIFVSGQESLNKDYYATALAQVTRQLSMLSEPARVSSAGLALESRAQSLATLAEIKSDTVRLAEAATPPADPSSPRTRLNTAAGGIMGLVLGLALVFALYRLKRTVLDPKELEELYDLPLLGVVPESQEFRFSPDRDKSASIDSGDSEVFQLINAHLRYFNVDRDLKMILVTSAVLGDGKTTISCRLAAAAAQLGGRVLLIETDVRRPSIARYLGLNAGPGLSDALIGAGPAGGMFQTVTVSGAHPAGEVASREFQVLVAGATQPPNPTELIASRRMSQLLGDAREHFDLVIIDTPPLTATSDAYSLIRGVDGVILVGRVNHDRRDVVARTSETLKRLQAPTLGVVANGVAKRGSGYYADTYTAPYALGRSNE